MVFSSLTFLVLFLPVFLTAYFAVPEKHVRVKNCVLLSFSLLFYASGEPVWVLILLFSGLSDYIIGLFITNFHGKWQAKALLILSMFGNLGVLILFKYTAFFFSLAGISVVFAPTLPIGISFYTFQTMSYTIDLYKGKIKPQRDPVAFLAYVSMFPQLVAGPIIRYADVAQSLTSRVVTTQCFSEGVTRFAAGLGKKVVFANHAGKIASELLGTGGSVSVTAIWLGSLMFMFQIYFDFSGYSDMAIGLGKMIGFHFKENFDHPYESKSITEFWRRWHISLGSFFRDYLYIPLGGNRKSAIRNILIVWLLTGLWHGASFNFIIWGGYFGIVLLIEKYFLRNALQSIPSVFSHVYSLVIILFGWVIFYFTDMEQLLIYSAGFWGFAERFSDHRTTELFLANLWILPIFAVLSTKIPSVIMTRLKTAAPVSEPIFNFIILSMGFGILIGQTYNPFLYFRF